MVNLGKSLKMVLLNKSMKQKTLAEMLATTPQQVSSWANNGMISQANIVAICDVLEIPVSEFIALGE